MELRSPDPSLNPYLAFALIISAGLDGIDHGVSLPPAIDVDLYKADESITNQFVTLPDNLNKAIELSQSSGFIKNTIGDEMLSKYLAIKIEEATQFSEAEDKDTFYKERYFNII
jgi:glutamine synthetase